LALGGYTEVVKKQNDDTTVFKIRVTGDMPTIESVVEEEVVVTYKDPIENALKKRLAAGS
jgi:hypothetical protein